MSSSHATDHKDLPVPLKESTENDLDYFTKAWWSGTRGGGSVPKDFTWGSNPKEHQEEKGAGK